MKLALEKKAGGGPVVVDLAAVDALAAARVAALAPADPEAARAIDDAAGNSLN